jgi:hypothetical protein
MTKPRKKYVSAFDKSLHRIAAALHAEGHFDDKTMREFDEGCLVKPKAKKEEAK